uniref:long-chain-fatty-acid--CoA ligase n=1 Tax=Nippostrongylus brasiliensis TaxID=27835 RepID=A0A0N4XZ85_NIPBR
MGDNGVNEELVKNGRPVYISAVIVLLKILFSVYDVIVYIPFKLFADPSEKLSMSTRTKASPVKAGDPSSAWRNSDSKDGELMSHVYDKCYTVAEQWNESVRKFADLDCFGTREVLSIHKEKQKNGKIFEKWEMGKYLWRSYKAVDDRVNMVASALQSIGCKKNDKIVLFAETREEWMTTALACFKGCFPVVTVYATLGEEAVEYALSEVNAKTVFTSENLLPKVLKAIKNGIDVKTVVFFESPDPESSFEHRSSDVELISFEELLNKGNAAPFKPQSSPQDLAVIMYTSGTTGNPKGVMISHENIVAAVAGQIHVIPIVSGDTYIGYLPLAHILEVCAETVAFTKGVRIGYSSAQTLFDRAPKIKKGTKGDCYALQPTLMACVPAVMDRIYKAVIEEVNSNSQLFREMFRACYERKRARYEEGYSSFILNKLVFNRIGKLLGGNIRCVLFMNICFCCPVVQGYGLTETCGGGTLADTYDLSTGTVGPPLTCCEIVLEEWKEGEKFIIYTYRIKIIKFHLFFGGYSPNNEKPQGEILIGGKNVAMGYYNNPEKTKEDFVERDGKRFFATGDIGEFREDGSLRIIDRKKDLLKLAHGEYISLGKVETNILTRYGIETVCAYGDSTKDYLVALLQRVEIPKKIHLCPEPWTPASGLITEALKLKRKTIEKAFRKELDALYC